MGSSYIDGGKSRRVTDLDGAPEDIAAVYDERADVELKVLAHNLLIL